MPLCYTKIANDIDRTKLITSEFVDKYYDIEQNNSFVNINRQYQFTHIGYGVIEKDKGKLIP